MNQTTAVVVTCNRRELLRQCVTKLLGQENASCDVIIIDNASTDGTGEMVRETFDRQDVIYENTGSNLGGAGGFEYGVGKAVRLGYEYVWIMDDDTLPEKTALANLFAADKKLDGKWGFLSSVAYWTDGSICRMNIQKKDIFRHIRETEYGAETVPVKMCSFVSLLVKSSVIREVGLPIGEYFIWTDDYEFTGRISRKYPCYMASKSRVIHAMKVHTRVNFATDDASRIERYRYIYRNDIHCYRQYGLAGWAYILSKDAYTVMNILKNADGDRIKRIRVVLKGFKEGLAFRPEIKSALNHMHDARDFGSAKRGKSEGITWSKKHLKRLLSLFVLSDTDGILSSIQAASAVSFDIFDTLVKRDVPSPEDVHILVDRRYSKQTGRKITDYQKRRLLAEQTARKNADGREITFKDIFDCFWGLTEDEKTVLRKLEAQTEYDVCCVNQYIKPVYDAAVASGKKVVLTSDMYLPEDLICRILEKCGIQKYDKLYLSSSCGVTKSSGKLFDIVLKDTGYEAGCILHIGDHVKSDCFRPAQKGIKACLTAAGQQTLEYWKKKRMQTWEQQLFFSFLNNHKPADGTDFARNVGYEILGPMLYGFTVWLHTELTKMQPDKVFFLSREGALLRQAYNLLYPDSPIPQEYLYVSRQALLVPLLGKCRSYHEMLRLLKPLMHTYSLENVGKSCQFDERYEKEIQALGLQIHDDLFAIPATMQEAFFQLVLRLGKDRFVSQYHLVRQYLDQSGLQGKAAVIDIGWQGTMQRALLSYAGKNVVSATGFYFVVRNMQPEKAYAGLDRRGFLAEPGRNEDDILKLSFTCEALEQLFMNPDGSVEGYRKNVDGKILPVLGRSEQSVSSEEAIRQVQHMALRFLTDFVHQKNEAVQAPEAEILMQCYDRFAVNPSLQTIRYFNSFYTRNSGIRNMLPQRSAVYYLLHPCRLVREMNESCCKIFYMKYVFKLPLPYFKILKFIYHITQRPK